MDDETVRIRADKRPSRGRRAPPGPESWPRVVSRWLRSAPAGVVAGGGWYLYRSIAATPDYQGDGTGDVVIQVHDEDTTSQIGADSRGAAWWPYRRR